MTGWNAQEFLPYESGYVSLAASAHLQGNGCENCHGPGGAHVAAEAGRDLSLRDKQRQAMRLTQATVELNVCVKCHDDDNIPHFNGNFAKYWQKIEHKGMKWRGACSAASNRRRISSRFPRRRGRLDRRGRGA